MSKKKQVVNADAKSDKDGKDGNSDVVIQDKDAGFDKGEDVGEEPEPEVEEPEAEDGVDDTEKPLVVADGERVLCKGGLKHAGETVLAENLGGGKAALDRLKELGKVV